MRPGRSLLVAAALAACNTDPRISSAGGGPAAGDQGPGGGSGGGAPGKAGPGGAGPGFSFPAAAPRGTDAGARSCGEEAHTLERLPPEIIVVLDRSKTMGNPVVAGAAPSRLDEVKTALDDIVRQTERTVHWGFTLFPSPNHCDVTRDMEVPVAPGNYAAMSQGLARATVNEGTAGTPMQAGVRKATSHFRSRPSANPKYIVLGTDGLPNCWYDSAMMRPRTSAYDVAGTVQAIRDARAVGVHTFVLGIAARADATAQAGVPDSPAALNMMAEAGGEPRAGGQKFYPVNSRAELVQALNDITVRVASCTFPLARPPGDPSLVTVKVDGKEVARDGANGWSFGADNRSIVINGAACDEIRTVRGRDPMVQVIYGCVVP
jgi:hypothetical protein